MAHFLDATPQSGANKANVSADCTVVTEALIVCYIACTIQKV